MLLEYCHRKAVSMSLRRGGSFPLARVQRVILRRHLRVRLVKYRPLEQNGFSVHSQLFCTVQIPLGHLKLEVREYYSPVERKRNTIGLWKQASLTLS